MSPSTDARVVAVHLAAARPVTGFAKSRVDRVVLRAGHGVVGDRHAGSGHAGEADGSLRQVHLVDVARYELLRAGGADVGPGHLGENVTTAGVDLLALGAGAVLRLGRRATLRLTGVRWPRHEQPGSNHAGLHLDADGVPVGRVGVFAAVVTGGDVRAGDAVEVLARGDGTPLPPL